jgi:hypothetical protein
LDQKLNTENKQLISGSLVIKTFRQISAIGVNTKEENMKDVGISLYPHPELEEQNTQHTTERARTKCHQIIPRQSESSYPEQCNIVGYPCVVLKCDILRH